MAHFAELNDAKIVLRVVVVGSDIPAGDGILAEHPMHIDGEKWCIRFFKGGSWKQTSYTNEFRKKYAGIGDIYDAAKNKFIGPQPYDSWALDANDDWQAPVTFPNEKEGKLVNWDEANQKWIAKDYSDGETPANNFDWDTSTLSWVSV
jgi:hypothetical protein|tara:strand:+ start:1794 stop:2237 length:444 start_codon:yes stop_codon:yes gene_type:complete